MTNFEIRDEGPRFIPHGRYSRPLGGHETLPRSSGLADQAMLFTGRVSLAAIALPKGFVVSTIAFHSLTTPAGAPTNWWFALCDSNYVTLRSTPDQLTAAWAANTQQKLALSSPFTAGYEGLYYLAAMVAATTVPTLAGVTQGSVGVSAILPLVSASGILAQTVPRPDGTLLANPATGTNVMPYAYAGSQ